MDWSYDEDNLQSSRSWGPKERLGLDRVGDYRIEDELARGGMGAIYRGRHAQLARPVAIKLLHGGLKNEAQLARFRREAEALARLSHPGIVAVHAFGEEEGCPYLVMDLVEGQNLEELLAEGELAPRRAAALVREVARALQHAHEQGVIHRDLKPSNVLLDERGQPRVTDFGLAGELEERARLTRTGQFIGTLGFAPPEQIAFKRERIDARSDVFALGATLYALLTGRPPGHQEGAPYAMLARVLNSEIPPPSALRAGLDPRLDELCMRCLAAERGERYPSAAALAEDLERFLADQRLSGHRVGLLQLLERRRRALVLGLALAPGLAILGWSASRFGRPAPTPELAATPSTRRDGRAIDWDTELNTALDLPGEHAEALALLSDPAHPELARRLVLTFDELSAPLAAVEEGLFAAGAPEQLPALRAELRAPFAAPLPAPLRAARRRFELELHRGAEGPAVLSAHLEQLQGGIDPSLAQRAQRAAAWLARGLVEPPAAARPALADALARLVRLEGAPLQALPYARALARLEPARLARLHRCLAWHGVVLARGLGDLLLAAGRAPASAPDLEACAGRALLLYLLRQPEALRACLELHLDEAGARLLLATYLLHGRRWQAGLEVLGDPQRLESARELGVLASLLIHGHRYEEADQAIKRALELDPREPWSWRAKGFWLLTLARRGEAARAFARESELDPLDPVPHYHRGRALRRDRRFRRSIAAFDAAIALDPRFSKPYRNRGVARARLGELDEALADVERAIELSPRDPYPLVVRARIKRRRGEPALPDLEAALRMDPSLSDAWSTLAEVHLVAGALERGLAACRQALAAHPEHPDGWATLGELERRAGRRAPALEAFARALDYEPDNMAALLGRAQLYLSEQDYEAALADLERAFRAARGAPQAAVALASGRRQAGDLTGALQLCNDVLEAAPHYDALLERASVQSELGHRDLALLDLERASEVAPAAARPHVQRGALLLRAKRYPAVLEAAEAALQRAADNPRALALRGLARQQLGLEGARGDLERYLRLEPRGSWSESVQQALSKGPGR